jgi:hypothetical protein
MIPELKPLSTMTFWLGILTLVAFVPTQLGLEGKITSRPREVNLILLLMLGVLLSIPFADDRVNSWNGFVDFLKVVLIFIVMVNVLRTETRWKFLVVLLLAISCFLGVGAVNNYLTGTKLIEGSRAMGVVGNLFLNPNDLALHLVTMIPLSVGMFLSTRNPLMKVFYAAAVGMMLAGIMVTQSRAGLLGLLFAASVLVWKLVRNRTLALAAILVVGAALIALAPSVLMNRFGSVIDAQKYTSVDSRKDDLKRSILVTLRHPLFGIGIDNFYLRSNRALATHNSYTQVSSEVGIASMVVYVMFLLTPLKRLRRVEHETVTTRKRSRYHYLAVGLQASLIGYMVCSFFASVAFLWYVYYLVALSICLARFYQLESGVAVNGDSHPERELMATANEPRIVAS